MQKLPSLLALTIAVINIALPSILSAQSYAIEVIHPFKSDKINETTQKNINYRIDSYENSYDVKSDYTYTQVTSTLTTLLTPTGIESKQRDSNSYYSETQLLELVEAYVIQPDGKKIKVTAENILTDSSEKPQQAGLENSKTITVSYPKLTVGSQTFIKWKLTQKKPSVIGFNSYEIPIFSEPTVSEIIKVSMPASLKLRWQKRGDYAVTDKTEGSRRVITATIKNQPRSQYENGMVSSQDISSMFAFSNLHSWEQLGATYWKDSHNKVVVTPEIKQLAIKITGNKQGIEAAQAIYNWVAQNINYVAVYLQEEAGYIPHSSIEVLRNGYGDCKDYVVLMQALLKAKGIDSWAVLVDWGDMYQNLPLPIASQFNHAMIYLPAFNIFANPTDKNASFGELGVSLRGKFVAIATEKGSTAYIPKFTADKNRYSMTSAIAISNNGTIDGESELKFFGDYNSNMRSYFASSTPEEIVNRLLADTPEGGTGTLETSNLNDLKRPVTLKAKWNSPDAINAGKKIYFSTPAGIDMQNPLQFRSDIAYTKRLYPMVAGAKDLSWEYKITVPSDYKVSDLPENKNFSNSAGEYTSSYQAENGYISIKRHLVIKNDVYSSEEYPAFKELVNKPINDVRSVMVLEKS